MLYPYDYFVYRFMIALYYWDTPLIFMYPRSCASRVILKCVVFLEITKIAWAKNTTDIWARGIFCGGILICAWAWPPQYHPAPPRVAQCLKCSHTV